MTQKNAVNSNNKKENLLEELLEYAGKLSHVDTHCDIRKVRELQIYL